MNKRAVVAILIMLATILACQFTGEALGQPPAPTYTPYPTYTALPSPPEASPPTEEPGPTQAQPPALSVSPPAWPVAFFDTFEDNRNSWPLAPYDGEFVSHTREISNGVFRWEATAKKNFLSNRRPDIVVGENFYMSVMARKIEGPENGSYGLVFWRVDSENYYVFRINDRQEYAFHMSIDGNLETVLDWKSFSAIQPGNFNKIAVFAEGPLLTFFVNDQPVDQFQDTSPKEGEAGLAIGLRNAGDTAIFEFDDFELRVP
jgi:hypothetical protein